MEKLIRVTLILVVTLLSFGCEKLTQTDCGELKCRTDATKTIYLSTVGADGKPKEAAYIETYNTRTEMKRIDLQTFPNYIGNQPSKYLLSSNPRDFSSGGDYITVLVKSQSGREFKLTYLIKGGNCTCEVTKISGPDVIKID